MSSVSSRCVAVCFGAIVCVSGCSRSDASDASDTAHHAASADPVAPAVTATSELQDWAKQATGGGAAQPDVDAPAASEPLATPVIHTVD